MEGELKISLLIISICMPTPPDKHPGHASGSGKVTKT